MYTTLYLILAHFLADFPFQPRKLVEYKSKYFGGVVVHSFTHLIASIVLLIPFLHEQNVWIGILVIFVMHNVIDQIKISFNRKKDTNKLATYLLDQLAHIGVIGVVATYYIGSLTPNISDTALPYYADQSIPLYFLILVLSTYFLDVTRWTYLNQKAKAKDYERDWGLIARNFIIVTVAFVIYWATR